MNKQLILAATVYIFYIFALAIFNFVTRFRAIKNQKISLDYFKSYQGTAADHMTVVGRHFDNQFQVPMLFLLAMIAHVVLRRADSLTLAFAWSFIISRIGHSAEHLAKNRIRHRVAWYAMGWFFVLSLWAQLCFFAWL